MTPWLPTLALGFITAVLIAQPPSGIHVEPGSDGGLTPRLVEALRDIEKRNPRAGRSLTIALRRRPREARRRLEEHARYLDTLRDARDRDPGRHRLLVAQEKSDHEVRALVARYHQATEDDARKRARDAIREKLDRWFDLRQSLREAQLQDAESKLEGLRARRDRLAPKDDRARRSMLRHLIRGGPEAMRKRVDQKKLGVSPEVLVPRLTEALMARDRESAKRFATIVREHPERLPAILRRFEREQPELLQEVRERLGDEGELLGARQRAVIEAQELLLPFVRSTTKLEIPPRRARAVRRALERVVVAERDVVDFRLRQLETHLAKRRRFLDDRVLRRRVIVDLKLARLIGRDELYAW